MHNPLARFFRREDAPTPSDSIVPPSRTEAPRDVLSLGAVFRAIQILTTSVSQLSLDAYRRGVVLETQPSIIRKPQADRRRSEWLMEIVTSFATNGNAFLRVVRAPNGDVLDLKVLPPHRVLIVDVDGQPLRYRYKTAVLSADEIIHLRFISLPGEPRGLGPVEAARRELHGALDLRDFASTIFERNDVPSGILSTDKDLTPEKATEAKNRWKESADGGVRIVGNGLKYAPITLNADDAQYIETRRLTRTEIAGLFGVPASLMLAAVEGSSMTYSNIEQEWVGYVRFTLMAYLRPIEDALSELLPHGQTARFNLEALLRGDTMTRYQAHALALTHGFMTVDEVRDIENRPAIGGRHAAQPEKENAE